MLHEFIMCHVLYTIGFQTQPRTKEIIVVTSEDVILVYYTQVPRTVNIINVILAQLVSIVLTIRKTQVRFLGYRFCINDKFFFGKIFNECVTVFLENIYDQRYGHIYYNLFVYYILSFSFSSPLILFFKYYSN